MKAIVLCMFAIAHFTLLHGIELIGHNGAAVKFDGVKEANSEGLLLKLGGNGDEIFVAWDKLDMSRLKEHPKVHAAYMECTRDREKTVSLMMGSYERVREVVRVNSEVDDQKELSPNIRVGELEDLFPKDEIQGISLQNYRVKYKTKQSCGMLIFDVRGTKYRPKNGDTKRLEKIKYEELIAFYVVKRMGKFYHVDGMGLHVPPGSSSILNTIGKVRKDDLTSKEIDNISYLQKYIMKKNGTYSDFKESLLSEIYKGR